MTQSYSIVVTVCNLTILFQTRNSGVTCFYAYEVQTILMESNTSHGAQIPQITGLSDISVELSFTMNSDLITN